MTGAVIISVVDGLLYIYIYIYIYIYRERERERVLCKVEKSLLCVFKKTVIQNFSSLSSTDVLARLYWTSFLSPPPPFFFYELF